MSKTRQSGTECKVTVEQAQIDVPLFEPSPNGYQSSVRIHDQLHISRLTLRQRQAMCHLYGGLRRANVEMEGRPIAHQNDAIRWLLDQIADVCVPL